MKMAADTYLSIVIPAFNEAHRLPHTLSETIAFLERQSYKSEILVVTDGSSDGTAQVASDFTRQFPTLQVFEFTDNRGKGFAVRTGMLAANGRYRLFMDADYAVPIDFAGEFLSMMEAGAEIVIGSRCHPQSHIEEMQRFPRRQLAIMFGYLQQGILRMPFRDTQCGFKMFTAGAAEKLFPLQTFDCAYFDAEILYIAFRCGTRIEEAPISWRHDQETRLPIGTRRTIDLLGKLFSIKRIHAAVTSNRVRRQSEDAAVRARGAQ
jgi:dolichyl-phosphate beta-glucosyltransferase